MGKKIVYHYFLWQIPGRAIKVNYFNLLNIYCLDSCEHNVWIYTFTPQYVFMAWCLVKHRDNLTFLSYTVWVLVNMIMNLHVPQKFGNFLTS